MMLAIGKLNVHCFCVDSRMMTSWPFVAKQIDFGRGEDRSGKAVFAVTEQVSAAC